MRRPAGTCADDGEAEQQNASAYAARNTEADSSIPMPLGQLPSTLHSTPSRRVLPAFWNTARPPVFDSTVNSFSESIRKIAKLVRRCEPMKALMPASVLLLFDGCNAKLIRDPPDRYDSSLSVGVSNPLPLDAFR